jgi:flagellar protein FlaG
METIRSALSPSLRVDGSTQAAKQSRAPANAPSEPALPPTEVASSAQQTAKASDGNTATQGPREKLQALLDQVGERIQPDLRALSFRVSEEIDGVVVSVIDSQTDELIRQIPTETMVRLAERLGQIDAESSAPGLLLNDQA